MKRLSIALLFAVALLTNAAAAPSAPGTPVLVGAPTNGFWLTNVYFVYTNTAIRTPTIDLGQVTAYGTNIFSKATVLAWTAPTNKTGLAGYKVYYGKTTGGPTNIFQVSTNISSTAFYSTLATTNQWWAFVTAYDTNLLESVASPQIVFTPK